MTTSKNPSFTFLLVAGIAVWLISIPVVTSLYGKPNSAHEFGDMFGAINALFSGLALAGIIYTIIIQREELRLTRDELKRAAEAQTNSAESLKKQLSQQTDASRLTALSALVNSANEQINQHDRWNDAYRLNHPGTGNKYDNMKVLEKRRTCESEIWQLLEQFKLSPPYKPS
jgi:hypothetical protein